ncbi:MAG: alpha/beta hydrolase [Gammaproteobacteria bacterium]|nr:alpha/beta hydrolase [Gammaproteobacteria bacterium]
MRFEVDGKRVFASSGTGQAGAEAKTVIFIHGGGLDHTVWVLPARYFARQGYRVIAPDLPGHGRSEGPALDTIEAMSDWIAAVAEALNVTQTAVVGHSMGSLVAYQFALAHRRRCRALALLGTSVPMPVTDVLLDAARDNHHAAIEMANTWSHSSRGKMGANENPGIWMMGAGERLIERSGPGVYFADFTACKRFDPQPVASSLDCPVLVIVADADQMTPARAGLSVADSLPNARIVRLEGCGHSMLNERPNAVLDALIEIV